MTQVVSIPVALVNHAWHCVYFVRQGEDGPIKIGTAKSLAKRMKELQTANPFPLKLIGTMPGGRREEKKVHRRFESIRLHGEWFEATPELLNFIFYQSMGTQPLVLVIRPHEPTGTWRVIDDRTGYVVLSCDSEVEAKALYKYNYFRTWGGLTSVLTGGKYVAVSFE